jgi:hypothetical protein
MSQIKCPDCLGDGIETCHNPDHGFLSGVLGFYLNANESACPCCGHNSDHKMKGKCDTCSGTGNVTKEQFDSYVDEFLPEDVDLENLEEICNYK